MIRLMICIVITLISTSSLIAQGSRILQDDVPLKIQAKFFGKYKEIKDVDWKKTENDQLIAHYW